MAGAGTLWPAGLSVFWVLNALLWTVLTGAACVDRCCGMAVVSVCTYVYMYRPHGRPLVLLSSGEATSTIKLAPKWPLVYW